MKFNNVAIALKHFGTLLLELLSEFTSCKRLSQGGMSCQNLELKGHLRLASLFYSHILPLAKNINSQLITLLVNNT